jgi:hypothetical protein
MPELDLTSFQRVNDAIESKRYGEAAGICQDMLEAMGDNPQVFAMLATVHHRKGEWQTAVEYFNKALAIKQDVAEWWFGLSKSYFYLYDYDACVFCGNTGIQLGSEDVDSLINMAISSANLGDNYRGRSEAYLLRALAHDRNNARAHMAMGEMLLYRKEFEAGWREYSWRKDVFQCVDPRPDSAEWVGQRMREGTLIVMTEGGFGDCIQFSRYIPYVNELCRDVVIGTCVEFEDLFRMAFPKNRVFTKLADFPPHAMHVGMIDLPMIFSTKPLIYGTNFQISDRAVENRKKIFFFSSDPQKMKVGLCWRGRREHKADRRRSMGAEMLLPLLSTPGCEFYSLQYQQTEFESALLGPFVKPFTGIQSWRDTAEHIKCLDLIIVVDTAVAHMAGTLGKETWVMLSHPAEWRWGMTGRHSDWYPSMTLWRQPTPGDWGSVIKSVAEALRRTASIQVDLTEPASGMDDHTDRLSIDTQAGEQRRLEAP